MEHSLSVIPSSETYYRGRRRFSHVDPVTADSFHSTLHVDTNTTTTTTTDGTTGNAKITVESIILDLDKAAQYNQGKGGGPNSSKHRWDVEFCQRTVAQYEFCLAQLYNQHQGVMDSNHAQKQQQQQQQQQQEFLSIEVPSPKLQRLLLSSETTEKAFRALLRCKVPTLDLSQKVRNWERWIGSLGKTTMTDTLSLQMLQANGKSGNVGRTLTLLGLRKSRNYHPQRSEFIFCITAIDAAGLYLRKNRNIFLGDKGQPPIDNPTRWLDAILLNMSQRGFALDIEMANRMLNTYASTGKSGKALHYFYRVLRTPLDVGNGDDEEEEEVVGDLEDGDDNDDRDLSLVVNHDHIAKFRNRPVKVRIAMRPPPPYHKIPSQARGKLVRKPGTSIRQLKLDRELDPDWSQPLTAAIAFADSLTQGA